MFISKKKIMVILYFFFYFKGFFLMKCLYYNKISYVFNEVNFNYLIIFIVYFLMKFFV